MSCCFMYCKHNYASELRTAQFIMCNVKCGGGGNPILHIHAHFGKIWVGNRQNEQEIFNFFNDCVKFALILAIFFQMPITVFLGMGD